MRWGAGLSLAQLALAFGFAPAAGRPRFGARAAAPVAPLRLSRSAAPGSARGRGGRAGPAGRRAGFLYSPSAKVVPLSVAEIFSCLLVVFFHLRQLELATSAAGRSSFQRSGFGSVTL